MSADNLLIAVIVLLILALVGLAVLLFRPRPPVTDSAALEAVDRSGREMREEIGRVRRDLGEVGSAQRTELSGSLNNFSQTLGTRVVISTGHTNFTAKSINGGSNALIIRRHNNTAGTTLQCLLIHPLDHAFAANISQRLTRQAAAGISCRYHH